MAVKKENTQNNGNEPDITFEAALERLEEIVRRLETGTAPLDDSLTLFEEGVSLVKLCNSRLDAAQQKITLMTGDGTEVPFAEAQPDAKG